ncbi:ABC transporter permease subunit [Carnobacterium funditum]|uniref:ABC transporter permease subunit n=1 Tax=Carnobacterium funditum TaxID=2752 RepID=UPI000554B3D0|nr:ABC transporter permease subunit [Carnobacterium funditum]
MISWPLFKKEMKSIGVLLLLFTLILTMYETIIISMFDPELGNIMADFEKAMPGIMQAFGMVGAAEASLTAYLSSYLFGFILIVFPLIFSIILSNKLVVKYVDDGSMAYLLATPTSRGKIIRTQTTVAIGSLILLLIASTTIGLIYSELTFPGELDISSYLYLNIGLLGLHLFINGFGFLISCLCNEARTAYSWSIGVPVLAFLIQMLANQGEQYNFLKYFTFLTLFSPENILMGKESSLWLTILLFILAFVMYGIGQIAFSRRNLPL